MEETFSEILETRLKRLLPFLVSVFLLLVFYVPVHLPLSRYLRPDIGMICVYFWLQHRPDLFNLGSVFCLGVLDDVVTSSPLGSNIFELLLMYVLVNNTSRFLNAKPFVVLWYGFALLALVTMLSRWLIVSVYYSQFLPLSMLAFSYMVTIAVYPLISLLLAFVQNSFIQDDE